MHFYRLQICLPAIQWGGSVAQHSWMAQKPVISSSFGARSKLLLNLKFIKIFSKVDKKIQKYSEQLQAK